MAPILVSCEDFIARLQSATFRAPREASARASQPDAHHMSQQPPHFVHVREHLERVRDGYSFIPHPEHIYLGRQDDDHFWELVGLRLQGLPVVMLAALRFERQARVGVPDSRESLASYLATTPDPEGTQKRHLTALLPHKDQQIPQFLAGLRAGREFTPVRIDRLRVEIAFDFRADNPAAVKDLREAAKPLKNHYFRTVDGHVLRGESHEVEPAHAGHRFLAVRSPQQLLPQGVIHMPTLFIAHRFIGLQVDVTAEAARIAARNWMPFLSATASKESLIPIGR